MNWPRSWTNEKCTLYRCILGRPSCQKKPTMIIFMEYVGCIFHLDKFIKWVVFLTPWSLSQPRAPLSSWCRRRLVPRGWRPWLVETDNVNWILASDWLPGPVIPGIQQRGVMLSLIPANISHVYVVTYVVISIFNEFAQKLSKVFKAHLSLEFITHIVTKSTSVLF